MQIGFVDGETKKHGLSYHRSNDTFQKSPFIHNLCRVHLISFMALVTSMMIGKRPHNPAIL